MITPQKAMKGSRIVSNADERVPEPSELTQIVTRRSRDAYLSKKGLGLFLILMFATIGAGITDVMASDVIPIRPYTSFFAPAAPLLTQVNGLGGRGSIMGDILGLAIIIVFATSLISTIANKTTGITISHTGFTPNPNITSSLGAVPILQLVPFVFVALITFIGLEVLAKHEPKGGF